MNTDNFESSNEDISSPRLQPQLNTFDELTPREKAETIELIRYLTQIGTLEDKYKIRFLKEKKNYGGFEKKSARIPDVFPPLKQYIQSVCKKNIDEAPPNQFILKMLNENPQAFNVFFYFFIEYLEYKSINGAHELSIMQKKVISSLNEASTFFFEKDVAVAMGYLLDVLYWSKNVTMDEENNEHISFLCLKSTLLSILISDPAKEKSGNDLNVYLQNALLYELAIREEKFDQKENAFIYLLNRTNEQKFPLFYQKLDHYVRIVNNPYKMQSCLIFQLIKCIFKANDTDKLLCCIHETHDLFQSKFQIASELISFEQVYEFHNDLVDKVNEDIPTYQLEKIDQLDTLINLKFIIDFYFLILRMVQSANTYLSNVVIGKQMIYVDLSEFQKKQLNIVLSDNDSKKSSGLYYSEMLGDIKKNLAHLSGDDHYNSKDIFQKIQFLESKQSACNLLVTQFYSILKNKYYNSAYQYINYVITEATGSNDMVIQVESPSKIKFNLRKNYLSAVFKKYNPSLISEDNYVLLDFDAYSLTKNIIDDILKHVINAYFTKQSQEERSKSVKEFYEPEKNLERMVSFFNRMDAEPKERPSEKLLPVELALTPINSPTFLLRELPRKKREKISECRASKQHHNANALKKEKIKNEVEQAIFKSNQKKVRDLAILKEARALFVSEKSSKENPQYTHIVNIVETKTARENLLIIAINKSLRDEHGDEIDEEEQRKVIKFIENIRVVRDFGEDGLKSWRDTYVLKMRKICKTDYRAFPKVFETESGAMVLAYDTLILKKNIHRSTLRIK